jgi:hypothetical protein
VQWLPVFEQECRELGYLRTELDLAQLIGGAPDSAGVHLGGGMADWWQTDIRLAQLARDMGAPATWVREAGSFANNRHTHSGLRGCPHMNATGLAQIREVDAGGDGLQGDAGDDPRLKPHLNKKTWQQGILWAKARQKKRKLKITFGTHNTLDGAAREKPFADLIIFTEAIPSQVRAGLDQTHRVWVCKQQKDLTLAVHKRLEPRLVDQDYQKVHGGRVLVTPARGTWRTDLDLLEVPVSGIWDHRINGAFPPFIRGEAEFRPRMWKKHDGVTNAMIRDAKNWAHVVLAGGDPNAVKRVDAYDALRYEVGEGTDRLASNREITDVEELSKAGSDHHRLRGTVQL